MAKYTEAYNDITNRNIDIMHVLLTLQLTSVIIEVIYSVPAVVLFLLPLFMTKDACIFVDIQTQYILMGAFLCWMSTLSKILVGFAEKTKTTL